MLGQLRLAWWRDRLNDDPAKWPKGEPLLGRLGSWGEGARALVALVDGWEALLGEPPLAAAAFNQFAAGRAAGVSALGALLDANAGERIGLAGRDWALADLALHLGDPGEQMVVRGLLDDQAAARLPRSMRPLAILAGLSRRALRRGSDEALDGPGALFAAIRLGFAGR